EPISKSEMSIFGRNKIVIKEFKFRIWRQIQKFKFSLRKTMIASFIFGSIEIRHTVKIDAVQIFRMPNWMNFIFRWENRQRLRLILSYGKLYEHKQKQKFENGHFEKEN